MFHILTWNVTFSVLWFQRNWDNSWLSPVECNTSVKMSESFPVTDISDDKLLELWRDPIFSGSYIGVNKDN